MAGSSPRLSGLNFWTGCTALILLVFERLATIRTQKEVNAMRYQSSVLHQILKHVPWSSFDRLVEKHQADRRVRRLSTKSQLIALIYGQLSGAQSLREIEAGLKSHESQLYHAGSTAVRRSTLSDANGKRPTAVFVGLFEEMSKYVHRGLRRELPDLTYLIDATPLTLNAKSADWTTRFSKKVYGGKLHMIYDPAADVPIYAALSAANVNDITVAKKMPIEPGATYVFDLGYYDYSWWKTLDDAGCRIVTRLKKNTPLRLLRELPVPKTGSILCDRIGFLPQKLSYTNRNPMADAVREVQVKTDQGKILRIFSNDLDADAQEIAALYKYRWQIELLFRWIKQVLRIRHFLGTSQNAVLIQLIVALIAYLALRLAQRTQTAVESPLAFTRLVRINLTHKRRIDRLLRPMESFIPRPHQMVLKWN
jgi:hypothetical protein